MSFFLWKHCNKCLNVCERPNLCSFTYNKTLNLEVNIHLALTKINQIFGHIECRLLIFDTKRIKYKWNSRPMPIFDGCNTSRGLTLSKIGMHYDFISIRFYWNQFSNLYCLCLYYILLSTLLFTLSNCNHLELSWQKLFGT